MESQTFIMPGKDKTGSFISQANDSTNGTNHKNSRKPSMFVVPYKSASEKIFRFSLHVGRDLKNNFQWTNSARKVISQT